MFAGAFLDGDGLVAPRRTTARINAAGVFQEVWLRAGALHLDRLAILKVWHKNGFVCAPVSTAFNNLLRRGRGGKAPSIQPMCRSAISTMFVGGHDRICPCKSMTSTCPAWRCSTIHGFV